jgi:hypothetical protein
MLRKNYNSVPSAFFWDNEFRKTQDLCHLAVNSTQRYLSNAQLRTTAAMYMSAVVKRGHRQRNGLSTSHKPVNTHARPSIHLIKFISILKVSTIVPAKRVWLLGCKYNYKTLVTPPNGNDEFYCKFISCKPIIKSRTFIEIRQRKFSDYGWTNKMLRKCGQLECLRITVTNRQQWWYKLQSYNIRTNWTYAIQFLHSEHTLASI